MKWYAKFMHANATPAVKIPGRKLGNARKKMLSQTRGYVAAGFENVVPMKALKQTYAAVGN